MTKERIEQIRESTLFPKSVSVQRALLQVWNECGQELTAEREKAAKLYDSLSAILTWSAHLPQLANEDIEAAKQSLTEYKKQ
jgi:hypothetical protein